MSIYRECIAPHSPRILAAAAAEPLPPGTELHSSPMEDSAMATPPSHEVGVGASAGASEKPAELENSLDDTPPAAAVSAVPQRKEPPPEKPESIRVRYLVILSFWAIAVLLGLPIWWRTTTIYRAPLPLDAMLDWADGRVSETRRWV